MNERGQCISEEVVGNTGSGEVRRKGGNNGHIVFMNELPKQSVSNNT